VRAWLNLRYTHKERARAFTLGLESLGYKVMQGATMSPCRGDILVTWNRVGLGHLSAQAFETRGLPVLVTENAAWGNGFAGDSWLTIAKNQHNTAGCFPLGDDARWDDLGIQLAPWRTEGETVLLPQRGIGSPPTAMPRNWLKRHHGRVRTHPGTKPAMPLEDDLANCGRVVTWGSGAAIKALVMGIPVMSDMPNWLGRQDNTDDDRLRMFRELAWCQFTYAEIESGWAFERLLNAN
jgi:hypothetical protein